MDDHSKAEETAFLAATVLAGSFVNGDDALIYNRFENYISLPEDVRRAIDEAVLEKPGASAYIRWLRMPNGSAQYFVHNSTGRLLYPLEQSPEVKRQIFRLAQAAAIPASPRKLFNFRTGILWFIGLMCCVGGAMIFLNKPFPYQGFAVIGVILLGLAYIGLPIWDSRLVARRVRKALSVLTS